MSVDDTFNKLLDEYKSNYVQFVTTGGQEYQKAYTIARDAIQSMISEKRGAVEKERQDMKHFVGAYKTDNESLGGLHDRAGNMHKNAQAIQDSFETSKQRYDNWLKNGEPSEIIDYTNGYGFLWRLGAVMVLLVLVFWIAYYNPGVVASSTSQTTVGQGGLAIASTPQGITFTPSLGSSTPRRLV